jgi:nicotinamide riboside kinase
MLKSLPSVYFLPHQKQISNSAYTSFLIYRAHPPYSESYHKLPEDLAILIRNKRQFLSQTKKYLMDKPYYPLQEFFEHLTDI